MGSDFNIEFFLFLSAIGVIYKKAGVVKTQRKITTLMRRPLQSPNTRQLSKWTPQDKIRKGPVKNGPFQKFVSPS
jgi:hypothetical protein